MSEVDGERNRLLAYRPVELHTEQIQEAQERALLTYLEAVALSGVLDGWTNVPEASLRRAAATFSGVLSPLDNGFATLMQGPTQFGVPEGYVPFVFNPKDPTKGPTNFRHKWAVAGEHVDAVEAKQQSFEAAFDQLDHVEHQSLSELQSIKVQYDDRLAALCGSGFDPEAITVPEDWESCGDCPTPEDPTLPPEAWPACTTGGEVGVLRNRIQQAEARWQAAQSRLVGMQQKIEIDKNTLASTQQIQANTIYFIEETGAKLETIAYSQGMVRAAQDALSVASNSQLFNGGAPAAMAGVTFAFGMVQASLDASRERLHAAQTVRG